ncbi:MAG: DegT/DnrJ/EryC1/StrS family aminotransferase [Desulfobacula sp.]|nr:DegT/DnrJ/EryC1/StrS family aminotransferase [Desulfobacula sp.]
MGKILAAKPSITQLEIDYVNDAIVNGWGDNCYDYIDKFNIQVKNYFNVRHVWPTSSCHGALHMVLMALGVGPGDEVIVPDATWVGSVFPINWLGAIPVFADVLQSTWCIDPEKIEEKITNNTKAIIAVHLYGNLCEMDEIQAIGKKYGLTVIEDAAEALGAEYKGKKAGAIADFGVFSFHGTKTVTTGEGGVIISNRDDMAEKLTVIDSQGRKPGARFFWVDEIGLKYKMSNIQAAIGTAQFKRANELVGGKRKIFNWYKEGLIDLEDIQINQEQVDVKNSYWMPTIIFGNSWCMDQEKRDRLIDSMNTIGISLRPFFYPVSSFPMYENVTRNKISYRLSCSGINLPSFHDMIKKDVQFVVENLIDYFERVK